MNLTYCQRNLGIVAAAAMCTIFSLSAVRGYAQARPRPQLPIFSGKPAPKAPPPPKPSTKPLTQQQVSNAVLARAIDDIYLFRDRHFHAGEYSHLINLSYVINQAEPHMEGIYSDESYYLWSTDRNAAAIAALKRGLKANPNDYGMYDALGEHYLINNHNPRLALPYYQHAVKFKCPWATWHMLAHAYERLGNWKQAAVCYAHAAKTYPDDKVAPVLLRKAEAHINSGSAR
ncbi:MAG: tetratricopeptide repeat protein [Armatimonadetes bacterium]|nr:tetratricopeptide repeat protein [Armatimonadota bacterium]MDE2206386.1 tetratricopeptide repeat protein [Armatimonadota bacterium]